MTKELIWFIPAIAVALGILVLSTFFAVPIQVEGVSYIDKWQHTFAYFVLSFSFLLAFKKSGRLSVSTPLWVLLSTGVYGLLLEFAQLWFFENRFFEWIDAVANGLGALLGYLFFLPFNKRLGG